MVQETKEVIVERSGMSGVTVVLTILVAILVAFGAYALIENQREDTAIEGAAKAVGAAAEDVGDAAQDAARKVD